MEQVVVYVKLVRHVTRWEGHLRLHGWIPPAQKNTPRRRVGLDEVDDMLDLIHAFAAVIRMTVRVLGTEMPPLEAVDRAGVEPPVSRVAVPNVVVMLVELLHVRAAPQEPPQFRTNGPKRHTLRCE